MIHHAAFSPLEASQESLAMAVETQSILDQIEQNCQDAKAIGAEWTAPWPRMATTHLRQVGNTQVIEVNPSIRSAIIVHS